MDDLEWWQILLAIPFIVAGHALLDEWQRRRRQRRLDDLMIRYKKDQR